MVRNKREAFSALALLLCLCWGMTQGTNTLVNFVSSQIEYEAVTVFSEVSETPSPTPEPSEIKAAAEVFRVEVVRDTAPPTSLQAFRVLIYHTHTWEAFEQVPEAPYIETEKWRSRDESVNMIAVGKALANALAAKGCIVVHDKTSFEPPNLSDAYDRSLQMLNQRKASGEVYDLYLDIHRDGISSASSIRRTVSIGGEKVARFMVLVGKGTYYDEKPDWEQNLNLAQRITDQLNQQCENLCRDVKVKTGRYNQHISPASLLIECGTNENTLEEVLRGIPYLADALTEVLKMQFQAP